jgi:hypothetical protein
MTRTGWPPLLAAATLCGGAMVIGATPVRAAVWPPTHCVDVRVLAARMNNYVRQDTQQQTVLRHHLNDLLREAARNDIDPRLLWAVARAESGGGTDNSRCQRGQNNIWNFLRSVKVNGTLCPASMSPGCNNAHANSNCRCRMPQPCYEYVDVTSAISAAARQFLSWFKSGRTEPTSLGLVYDPGNPAWGCPVGC